MCIIRSVRIRRTISVRLYPTREQKAVLKEISIRCSRLWNRANYIARRHYFKTGEVLTYEKLWSLAKKTKEYKALPSDIAQAVLKKLAQSWSSFKELKRLEEKGKLPSHINRVSPPKYYKDRKRGKTIPMNIPILSPRSFSLGDFSFSFTVPEDFRRKPKEKFTLLATYTIPYGDFTPKWAEVIRKNGRWYVHVSGWAKVKRPEVKGENYASIDLGARNLITLTIYDAKRKTVRVYQFKSKELWKEFCYWERRIAKYRSKLAKSGHEGRAVKLRKLYEKRNKRITNAVRAIANKVVLLLQRYGVKKVLIGDLTGIRNGKDFGKLNKLLHNFWIRRKIEQILKDKLEIAGIGIDPIPESYTSSFCICGGKISRCGEHIEEEAREL